MRTFSHLGLIIASFALTACFDVRFTQTINRDATTTVVMRHDFSKFMEAVEAMQDLNSELSIDAQPMEMTEINCKTMQSSSDEDERMKLLQEEQSFKMLGCKDVAKNIVEFSFSYKMPRSSLAIRKVNKKTVYIYRFNTKYFGPLDESQQPHDSEDVGLSDEDEKALLPTVTYIIRMPAKIVKSTVGTIDGDTVTFTGNDMKRRVVIRAED